jgi:hypothetical protein
MESEISQNSLHNYFLMLAVWSKQRGLGPVFWTVLLDLQVLAFLPHKVSFASS